jgi:glucose/arabinose dehydrogenase
VRRTLAAFAVVFVMVWVAAARAAPIAAPGQLVAAGIPYATNVTFDARGGIWITSGAPFSQPGDGVWYVAHAGATPVHVIHGTLMALGLTWFRGRLYVTSALSQVTGIVARYTGFDGRRFAHRRVVVPALSIGRHALGTIVPGPNGRLYVGVGAEHDTIAGGHATSGTVVSFKGDGSDLRIEATGLRGPYGLAGRRTSSTSCATSPTPPWTSAFPGAPIRAARCARARPGPSCDCRRTRASVALQ